MKRKIIGILSLILCLVLCISAAACGKQDGGDTTDKHEAKTEWQWNEAEHWHDCATEGHTDKLEVAAHTFDAGVITVEPTETATGEKTFTCTVCGYAKKEVLPALGHKHSFGTEWKNDDLNHWHECACGEKSEEEAHKFGEWKETKPATETEMGEKERVCSVCEFKETAKIPELGHVHSYDTEKWSSNGANHWHECACGDKTDVAAHTFGDWNVTKPATETETGSRERLCSVCGYKETARIPMEAHTHKFATEWTYDETNHWHASTCGHEVKEAEAAHTFNDGVITKEPTETEEGEKTFTCTVCGATKTEPVAKLTHTHTFDMTKWEKDATYHWHKATCGHTAEVKDKAAHVYDKEVVSDEYLASKATYAEPAKYYKSCECGAKGTETFDKGEKLSPKDNTVTVGTIDFTYNAKSQPIDSLVTAGNKEGMVVKYVGVDGTTYEESTTAPTNAGTYQYTITIPATAEWSAAEVSGKFTIAKYELTMLYEKRTAEYNGTDRIWFRFNTLEDNTRVNIAVIMDSANVGAKVSDIVLPGLLKTNNYTVDKDKVQIEITPKKLNGLEFSVKMSEIDEEGGETDIEREIDGVKDEKIKVIITFSQSELYNESYLDLSTDGSLSGTCKISFKTETVNYVFERDGLKGIGELKLIEDVSGIVAEGDFVEGAKIEASKLKVTDDDYTAAITKIADKSYDNEKVVVYDISLIKDDAKVQPNGKVKVTIPAPFETENGYVTYHISGENVEELETTLNGGKISFETESFSYFIVVGKRGDNAPAYTLVDKNGKEDVNGGYVLFGSYPQTAVKETALKSALAQKAGALPENGNNGKWTSYKYYSGKNNASGNREATNETDFMWYIDVEQSGEKYRGVYFTYYRPSAALGELQDDSASYIYGKQKSNGYKIGELYWFKYEPILWQIIRTENGKAQLLCMTAIDSQAYTLVTKKSEGRFEDELDAHYVYYNAMTNAPENTLATNYEYSAIREWLNGSFYQNAFSSKQKNLIIETLLDNKAGDVGANTSDKVFVPSIAELADVKGFDKKVSDYAKSQGVETSYPGTYCWFWYTRDAYYVLRFQDKANLLSYDKDRYKNVCGVQEGILYNATGAPCSSSVEAASCGVVPSLWITL